MNLVNILLSAAAGFVVGYVGSLLLVLPVVYLLRPKRVVLTPMVDNTRKLHMGQTMAECDCPRESVCSNIGYCLAERLQHESS